jgi:hypothetical protein
MCAPLHRFARSTFNNRCPCVLLCVFVVVALTRTDALRSCLEVPQCLHATSPLLWRHPNPPPPPLLIPSLQRPPPPPLIFRLLQRLPPPPLTPSLQPMHPMRLLQAPPHQLPLPVPPRLWWAECTPLRRAWRRLPCRRLRPTANPAVWLAPNPPSLSPLSSLASNRSGRVQPNTSHRNNCSFDSLRCASPHGQRRVFQWF